MNLSQKRNPLESKSIAWTFLIIILGIWAGFSYHNWITDSEFWPITVSREVWNIGSTSHPAIFYKPVFHLSLAWLHLLPLDNVQHVMAAKVLYTGIGVGIFLFSFLLAWQVTQSSFKSLIYVTLLLSSALVFSNLAAIRSDMLVVFFALGGMVLWPQIVKKSFLKQFLFWLVSSMLILGSTPKGIYVLLSLFVAYKFFCSTEVYKRLVKSAVVSITLFLGTLFLLRVLNFHVRSWDALISALAHGINSQLHEKAPFLNYWLKPYAINDVTFFFVALIGQAYSLFVFKKQKGYATMSLILFVVLIIYNPKHLFFVASFMPLLLISILPVLKMGSNKVSMFILIIFLSVPLINKKPKLYFYSNYAQFVALSNLNNYFLNKKNFDLLDGIGLLPRVSITLFYLGPEDEFNDGQVAAYVLTKHPDYVLKTPRVLELETKFEGLFKGYKICEYGLVGYDDICETPKDIKWEKGPWETFGYNNPDRIL